MVFVNMYSVKNKLYKNDSHLMKNDVDNVICHINLYSK